MYVHILQNCLNGREEKVNFQTGIFDGNRQRLLDALLRAITRETRLAVARVLTTPGNLLIDDTQRLVSSEQLLRQYSKAAGKTTQEYIDLLQTEGRNGGLYGGGPELAVLSNILRRPISIYELDEVVNQEVAQIVCKGTFGSFEDPLLQVEKSAVLNVNLPGAYSWHIHILIVDANAKDKHACVLLPQKE